MVLTWINPHIRVLKLATVGFLVINSFVLCLDTYLASEASSERLDGHQQVLYGPEIQISPSSVGKVLEIPLQRRFIEHDGRFYFLNISVGSPAQSIELLVDTGSTDTWVYGSNHCMKSSSGNHFQCYDPEKSNTAHVLPAPPYFEATYGRRELKGLYMKDEFGIGTRKLKCAEFGMVHKNEGKDPAGGGLLGLGFDTAEFGPNKTFRYSYPDILDSLYNESIIDSRAFGLYLNNGSVSENEARGSLVLGGYDKSKFTEPLVSFAIESPSDVRRLGAPLASISAIISGTPVSIWVAASDKNVNSTSVPAVLDSGYMISEIPVKAHDELVKRLNRYSKKMLKKGPEGDIHIDCSHSSADISINFTFIGHDKPIAINVPFLELVLPAPSGEGAGDCLFALRPKERAEKHPYWLNFGSSIVDSMYLIVDYDKNTVQIAKARYDEHEAEIVPINHRSSNLF